MTTRFVDIEAPEALRRVLLELIEEQDPEFGEGPLETLARLLDVPVPSIWGGEAQLWVREQVERMRHIEVFEGVEDILAGRSSMDDRINRILRRSDAGLECVDGRFYNLDEVAGELEVDSIEAAATAALSAEFQHVGKQWDGAMKALRNGHLEDAVAGAVNALEGAVRTASGKKSINDGLKSLFPDGHRTPLVSAINQLHNYGSAMPNVRHGGSQPSTLGAIEARGVVRACAVWITMIVNMFRSGQI